MKEAVETSVDAQAGTNANTQGMGGAQTSDAERLLSTGPSWRLAAAVGILTFAAHAWGIGNGFVEWDDAQTVLTNPYIRRIDSQTLRWMFTTFHMGPYQPLAWLSLALDYKLAGGLFPPMFHFTNVLFHSLTAVLLLFCFWCLLARSGDGSVQNRLLALGAAGGALLWAVHPLRVESVAWVTERRDVLSGFFAAATVLVYLRAVSGTNRKVALLFGSLVCFLLALLSKATVVPLPVVLLLLDWYPLRRWGKGRSGIWPVLLEKTPFFLASIVFGILAIYGQHSEGMMAPGEYPLGRRIASALFGVGFYLAKTVAPLYLSPLYEQPLKLEPWHYGYIIAGGLLFVIGSAVAWRSRYRWPAFSVAWTIFLCLLAPVSGLLQTGPQIAADRYTYLSTVPLFVLAGRWLIWFAIRTAYETSVVLTSLVYIGLAILTHDQTMIWNNDISLWEHAISVQPRASLAYANLAAQMYDQRDYVRAENLARQAIAIRPDNAAAHNVLANVLTEIGRLDEAEQHYLRALESRPNDPVYLYNYATLLRQKGKNEEAVRYLQKALEIRPDFAPALNGLAILYREAGRVAEAEQLYRRILEADPCEARALYNLGNLLYDTGRRDEALDLYRKALECDPTLVEAAINLAVEYENEGRWQDAFRVLNEAYNRVPTHERLRYRLGLLLAAAPDDRIRDLRGAELHARWLLQRSEGRDPYAYYLLAEVRAAEGRFTEALELVQQGLEIARRANYRPAIEQLDKAAEAYRAGRQLGLGSGRSESGERD